MYIYYYGTTSYSVYRFCIINLTNIIQNIYYITHIIKNIRSCIFK
jgi:hypothetical protein